MAQKLVVGPLPRGLRNDVTPFNVDNTSFPTLINAYQWRGRVKRKRGTETLGRLTFLFNSLIPSQNPTSNQTDIGVNGGTGIAQLLSGNYAIATFYPNASIVPGTVSLTDVSSTEVYTDLHEDGTLQGNLNLGHVGTINYATGEVVLLSSKGHSLTSIFQFYPDLPVMGIEDLALTSTQFPGTLAFDTVFSYNINTAFPFNIYNVSFYANPQTGFPGYTDYVQKTILTPTTWNGQDYQQFWTFNYQGALWATNGINVPFNVSNIGMQYAFISAVAINSASGPAVATITTTVNNPLVIGDFVFINEIVGMTGINWQTGYITAKPAANQITVTFPNAIIAGAYASGGIVQYLTNRSDTTVDNIRWYDGDPTDGTGVLPTPPTGLGWVNFMPPLSEATYIIADLPAAIYYLVGARMIIPFKDRLLFLGPVVQSSVAGSQVYLQDTIIYSQNGTPYYTASYKNFTNAAVDNPVDPKNQYNAILVPANQTAAPNAYFEDSTGFGGFKSAGISQPILTCSSNEDALIIGFSNCQTKLIYNGNDIDPFEFFYVNTEYGSGSTFSAVNFDRAVMTRGQKGYINTSQTDCGRFDLEILDEVFEMGLENNGNERVTAQRDFISEWVYFTYPNDEDQDTYKFPNQTLQFNYRDNSWAIFLESYTTYGSFRKSSGLTWGTVGSIYPTWADWNVPWNASLSNAEQPLVIGGNQQGFILFRNIGTGEGTSLYIQNVTGSTSTLTVPDHTLNEGDYIQISGVIGTYSSQLNGQIFSVSTIVDSNNFTINPSIVGVDGSGNPLTYLGLGLITRMYVPFIQTRQFPLGWDVGKKTRIGVQRYLLTATPNSQIQLQIYLSQDSANPYNTGPIYPSNNVDNDALVYSTVLFTCPESTNLGLSPYNTNLNMPTAITQDQIWHRNSTSLIGDTVQLGFTMSDEQMRAMTANGTPVTITGASQSNPCVLLCSSTFLPDQVIEIDGIVGMTQLNQNYYIVVSVTTTTVTINVDSTTFTTYISGGTATPIAPNNQFAEIELHGFIIDVSPSMDLC
jgi:hypothetical protein